MQLTVYFNNKFYYFDFDRTLVVINITPQGVITFNNLCFTCFKHETIDADSNDDPNNIKFKVKDPNGISMKQGRGAIFSKFDINKPFIFSDHGKVSLKTFDSDEESYLKIFESIKDLSVYVTYYRAYQNEERFIQSLARYIVKHQKWIYASETYTFNHIVLLILDYLKKILKVKFSSDDAKECVSELFKSNDIVIPFNPVGHYDDYNSHLNKFDSIIKFIEYINNDSMPRIHENSKMNKIAYILANLYINTDIWNPKVNWIIDEMMIKCFVKSFCYTNNTDHYDPQLNDEESHHPTIELKFDRKDVEQKLIMLFKYVYEDDEKTYEELIESIYETEDFTPEMKQAFEDVFFE